MSSARPSDHAAHRAAFAASRETAARERQRLADERAQHSPAGTDEDRAYAHLYPASSRAERFNANAPRAVTAEEQTNERTSR